MLSLFSGYFLRLAWVLRIIRVVFLFSCNFCLHYKSCVGPEEEENTNEELEIISKTEQLELDG